jgi:hypothetical protein
MTTSETSNVPEHPRVNTKTVAGRRVLHFNSLDEVVVDATRLVSSPNTRMLGNWPLAQLLTHLATAINGSIDGISARAPWYVRIAAPLIKRRLLTRGMPPGFRLPRQVEPAFFPSAASPQAALETFRSEVARTKNEMMSARHPVLGKLSHNEWNRLHLRHAELHLSFANCE